MDTSSRSTKSFPTRSFFARAKQSALRSTIASIMARNMDHLIGSHIETSIAQQMPSLRTEIHGIINNPAFDVGTNKELYSDDFWMREQPLRDRRERRAIDSYVHYYESQYANYRLKRMDLIARFSTEWIPWNVGMSFYHQVIMPFLRNGILLHFLGHAEGLHLCNLDIKVIYPIIGSSGQLEADEHREANLIQEDTKVGIRLHQLPQGDLKIAPVVPSPDTMSLRGGDVGVHAFHILLENILRNSVKHNLWSKDKLLKLKIWLIHENTTQVLKELGFVPVREDLWKTVERDSATFWFVIISSDSDIIDTSDLSSATSFAATGSIKLEAKMDGLIRRTLITETGEIDQSSWGMKEKKICAAYLSGGTPMEVNSDNPNYLWAGAIKWEPEKPSRLAYCLKIPKAELLLYIDNSKETIDEYC